MSGTFLRTVTGSFSTPAGENPTVVMMEAAFAHHGLAAQYLNLDVPAHSLADAVRGARAMGWAGFNCSLPHKVSVLGLLDRLDPSAEIVGAVNCVVREGDDLVGHNTDGQGFVRSLRETVDPAGLRALVLGAGGAARAVAVELARAGADDVVVASRSAAPGEDLADLVARRTSASSRHVPWQGSLSIPPGTDLVVNATSVGLHPAVDELPPVDLDGLGPSVVVADVIPNPATTAFLREAAARGAGVLDGLGMLVNQGAVAVRLWTGVDPDRQVMRDALAGVFAPAG